MTTTPSPMRAAFETWYGYEVTTDMDIHTEIAWGNWQRAWNAANEERESSVVLQEIEEQKKRRWIKPIGNQITASLKFEKRWPVLVCGFIGHREFLLMLWAVSFSITLGY